jgi:arginyl-tRNA--protein-N-Asp/Glu arginylyltransferase
MQLYFDHIAGVQSGTDYIHCLVSATFERFEFDWALNNGWAPSNVWYNNDTNFVSRNEMIWYQSRQTRINLSRFTPDTPKEEGAWKKARDISYEIVKEPDLEVLYAIYHSYMNYRTFSDRMNRLEFERSYNDPNLIFILFGRRPSNRKEKKLKKGDDPLLESFKNLALEPTPSFCSGLEVCAFSVLEEVGNSLIAHQFCWDYEEPQLSLGKFATFVEIKYARHKMYEAVYMGPSYELSSKYKSNFPGFEWWTGRKWSTDVRAYENRLMVDESCANRLGLPTDVVNYYNDFFKELDV